MNNISQGALSHINPEEAKLLQSQGPLSIKDDPSTASLGRYGDSLLAYLKPEEENLLKNFGGSGTINPQTGLPEFWGLGDLNPVRIVTGKSDTANSLVNTVTKPVEQTFNTVKGAVTDVGKVVTDVTGGALSSVSNIADKIGTTLSSIANDPKKLAGVALMVAFPEAATTIGDYLLPESVATTIGTTGTAMVGQSAINAAINGGDVDSAIKAALIQQGMPAVAKEINTSQFSQNLQSVLGKYGAQATTAAGLATIMGKDPTAALLLSGAQAATNALLTQQPDIKAVMDTLPQPAQKAISSALYATLANKDPNQAVADSLINSAVNTAKNYLDIQKESTSAGDAPLTSYQLLNVPSYTTPKSNKVASYLSNINPTTANPYTQNQVDPSIVMSVLNQTPTTQGLDSTGQFLKTTMDEKNEFTNPLYAEKLHQLYSSLTPELQQQLIDSGVVTTADNAQKTQTAASDSDKDLQNMQTKFMASGGSTTSTNPYSNLLNFQMIAPPAPSFLQNSSPLQLQSRLSPLQQLKSSLVRNSPFSSMAKGGLPHKYEKAAPKGHNPEFITGVTGYYAGGRGTGQSDDIPAMLHDGDYVMDADAVAAFGDGSSKAGNEALMKFLHQVPHHDRKDGEPVPAKIADGEVVLPESFVTALGGGDNKHGAKMLDAIREELREHKRSAPTSKIPPKAKSPLEYLKMAKG